MGKKIKIPSDRVIYPYTYGYTVVQSVSAQIATDLRVKQETVVPATRDDDTHDEARTIDEMIDVEPVTRRGLFVVVSH